MIEILGLLGGAVTRLFPSVLDFFKQGRDAKYELQRMKMEYSIEVLRGKNRQDEIQAMSNAAVDANWSAGLIAALENQTKVTGDKWLDRINVSVRPILTYWWCIVLYSSYKIIFIVDAIRHDMSLSVYSNIIWTEFDGAVTGSIIGFWFVDRALRGRNARNT
jgi:hypothetical protein